jgi:hypothetical protein
MGMPIQTHRSTLNAATYGPYQYQTSFSTHPRRARQSDNPIDIVIDGFVMHGYSFIA